MTKAIILLSGGLDSSLLLTLALKEKKECFAISFDYGQRHKIELEAAKMMAKIYHVPHKIISISPDSFGRSSLVSSLSMKKNRTCKQMEEEEIPNTYVPARNTLFLSYALAQAELFSFDEIHIGSNLLDHHPYPDCRPVFFEKFQELVNIATKETVLGKSILIKTPLLYKTKIEIVQEANRLQVPISLTFSCYDPENELPCTSCDACILRNEALATLS